MAAGEYDFGIPVPGKWAEFIPSNTSSPQEEQDLDKSPHIKTGNWITLIGLPPEQHSIILPHGYETGSNLFLRRPEAPEQNIYALNSTSIAESMRAELGLLKSFKSAISSVKNLLFKVKNALNSEKKVKKQFHDVHSTVVLKESHGETTNHDIVISLKLPKLVKLDTDMILCFKSSEITINNLFQSKNNTALRLKTFFDQYLIWKKKLLMYVRWLILERLENIGTYFMLLNKVKLDLTEHLYSNETERLCKLIESYNKSWMQYMKALGKGHITDRMLENSVVETSILQTSTTLEWKNSVGRDPIVSITNLSPITINVIQTQLAKNLLQDAAINIVEIIRNSIPQNSESSDMLSRSNNEKQAKLWHLASTKQAQITIAPSNLEKRYSLVTERLHSQEKILSVFLKRLGGDTKILHNRQDSTNKDTSSVVSFNSRTSSSLAEFKTVSWKDLWNTEAMKSIASNHIVFLLNSVPPLIYQIEQGRKLNLGILPCFSSECDSDLIALESVLISLNHRRNVEVKTLEAVKIVIIDIITSAALTTSDSMFMEMLGNSSRLNKLPSKTANNGKGFSTNLCMHALQPLCHLLKCYPQSPTTAKLAIPLVESILNYWLQIVKSQIESFLVGNDIPGVLRLTLDDLVNLTSSAMNCLKLVEICHNHVEKQRDQESATLVLTSKSLRDIDSLITDMQMLSTSTMDKLKTKALDVISKIVAQYFPQQKMWIQKSSIDNEIKNKYVQEINDHFLKIICTTISKMDAQFQLAGIVPIITAVYEAILKYIAEKKIKFSVQGGLQLSYDFSVFLQVILNEDRGLKREVRNTIPSLPKVVRATEIAELFHRTDHTAVDVGGSQRSGKIDVANLEQDITDLRDSFWLSLRKDNRRDSRKWSSLLPCMDN